MVDHAVDDYVVASPDYDIFTEQCSDQNVDLVSFHRSGPGGIPPVGVPIGAVYGFAPMTAQQLSQLMSDGRVEGAAERVGGAFCQPLHHSEPMRSGCLQLCRRDTR